MADNDGQCRAILVHSTRVSGLRMAAGMAHEVRGPGADVRAQRGVPGRRPGHGRGRGSARREAADHQVRRLRLVVHPLPARGARSGRGRPGPGPAHRMGSAARRAAGLPRRLLGRRRRGGDRRPGDPAGRAVRPVPRPAGRGPRRGAAHRGQGADRPRLRRAHVLGHRDVRAAGADLHPARGRRGRAALASFGPAAGPRTRLRPGPAGRGVPVADHRRPGVLRLLAGRHRRVPHQRGHRGRGHQLPPRHRG